MRSRWLAVLVLMMLSPVGCATDDTNGDESASTTGGAGADEEFGDPPPAPPEEGGGEDVTPPPPATEEPPVATDKCVDDEDYIGADGNVHLEPGGCELVDDTSQCCLDTTGTKWICSGGDEFPGVVDIVDVAQYPCPGL